MNQVDPWGLEGGFWGGMKKIGAGFGKLWEKTPAGIGEAVSKGVEGAGEAFGKLGHEYATNKDLQKYTGVALGAGLAPIAAATAPQWVPAVATAAAPYAGRVVQGTKKAADVVAKGYNYLDKAIGKAAEPVAKRVGPALLQKGIEVAGDLANPMPPAQTKYGQAKSLVEGAVKNYEYYSELNQSRSKNTKDQTRSVQDDWWGR